MIDDGITKVVDTDATDLAINYYTEYSKYVLEYRALPSIYDGLKPVQRRIIYITNQRPAKLTKTAEMAGSVMAIHPHSSDAISGAIVEMAASYNNLPLFETKGNFGGYGFPAAADRYTECYLNDIAKYNFCQFIDYADYELGEVGRQEPSALPTLIPYSMFKGSEGIAIGLSTKVMPLNLIDLIDYYLDYIKTDGKPTKKIKPDIGYVLIDMDNSEIQESINECKGSLSAKSIVTQVSDTEFIIEGLFDKTLDSFLNKLDKKGNYLSSGKVGFRDESTSKLKYVFEIYDSSLDVKKFKKDLVSSSVSNKKYCRVLEQDGKAVYSNFIYSVQESLKYLNKAIDRKIEAELGSSNKKILFYEVLELCKKNNVFNNISKNTAEELVDKIIKITKCSEEIAREIVKKPITYLTKSHDKEYQDLLEEKKKLENHNRKEYLIELYSNFRKMVMPIYKDRKHSLIKSQTLKSAKVSVNKDKSGLIISNSGEEFNNSVYVIFADGTIEKKTFDSTLATEVSLDHQKSLLINFVTDKYNYIKVITKLKGDISKHGEIILDLSQYKSNKSIKLRDNEIVLKIIPMTKVTKVDKEFIKNSYKTTICKGSAH